MHTGIVSDHFSWLEVEHSQTAERLGLNNDVPAYLEKAVLRTAVFMEQVRSLLGHRSIHVDSWYRGAALQALPEFKNPKSQHPLGEAVDFVCPAFGDPVAICRCLSDPAANLPFDQLILEHSWVHISFSTADPMRKPRSEVLSLLNNKGYARGLTDKQGNPL